ncbi:MAG: ATP-binding cassette domain-containing protein [Planctomycetota bacterium]|jgi:putative ABC transport system ATP-binding protein|nr:ATP-binding cassette domain-containing protein [Planctomycetota bacterium]
MLVLDHCHFARPGGFRIQIPELRIPAGQQVAIIGPSGCGKTTLLHLLAGILVPQLGVVSVADTRISQLSDAARRAFRLCSIGLVFQEFELLEHLTVLDNALLPLQLGAPGTEAELKPRAITLLNELGLGDDLQRHPQSLSQGERQRLAVCRALLLKPPLLLADEPTGNLDPDLASDILDLVLAQARSQGAALVVVTHDHGQLNRFDLVIDLPELICS